MDSEGESEKKKVDVIVGKPSDLVEEIDENDSIKTISSEFKASKWKIVKQSNHVLVSEVSKGNIRLANLINELQHISNPEHDQKSIEIVRINSKNWIEISRRYLSNILNQSKYHYFIIILVVVDLIVVFVDLILAQLSTPCLTDDEMIFYNTTQQRDSCLLPYSKDLLHGELFLFYFSFFLLIVFVTDVFVSLYAFGWRHYKNPLYLMDGIVVLSSFIMELYFHYGNIGRAGRAAAAIVVLRLWKIVRAIHAVAHSITVKNNLLIKKIQEAQIAIEEDKINTEKMLEKQDIKLEYLINILKASGKCPNPQQIDKYVEKTWKERRKQT